MNAHRPSRLAPANTAPPMPVCTREEITEIVHEVVNSLSGDLTIGEFKLFHEVEGLARFIHSAKQQILDIRPDDISLAHIPAATTELDAVVAATATLLGNVDNQIEIIAHTGLDPTASAGPDAWVGALDLADRVAAVMAAAGIERPVERSGRTDLPGGRNACAAEIVLHDATVARPGGHDGGA
jgi:hypothetical protein